MAEDSEKDVEGKLNVLLKTVFNYGFPSALICYMLYWGLPHVDEYFKADLDSRKTINSVMADLNNVVKQNADTTTEFSKAHQVLAEAFKELSETYRHMSNTQDVHIQTNTDRVTELQLKIDQLTKDSKNGPKS